MKKKPLPSLSELQLKATDNQRIIAISMATPKYKKSLIAYVLLFLFNIFGIHRFYLGYTGMGVFMLISPSIGLFILLLLLPAMSANTLEASPDAVISGVSGFLMFLFFLAPGIIAFADIFQIPKLVEEKNNKILKLAYIEAIGYSNEHKNELKEKET